MNPYQNRSYFYKVNYNREPTSLLQIKSYRGYNILKKNHNTFQITSEDGTIETLHGVISAKLRIDELIKQKDEK